MKRNPDLGVDIDAVHHRIAQRHKHVQSHLPHCAGPCEQGRKLCPCPTACGIDDNERNAKPLPWYVAELVGVRPEIVSALAVVAAIIAVAAGLHYFLT